MQVLETILNHFNYFCLMQTWVFFLHRYKIITTERRVWWALGLCWFLSLLVGLVPMFGWHKAAARTSEFLRCQFISVMRMDYMVYLIFFAWTLVPLLIM